MMTLPHAHETGECLACDLETVLDLIRWEARHPVYSAALDRISTALATTREAQLEQQRWEIWSTMQLNVDPDLHGQAMRDAATVALATSQAQYVSLLEVLAASHARIAELEQRLARVAELAHDRDDDTLARRSDRLGKCASVSWDHMEEALSTDPLKRRSTLKWAKLAKQVTAGEERIAELERDNRLLQDALRTHLDD